MPFDAATLRCLRCDRKAVWLAFDHPKIRLLVCWPCRGVLALESTIGGISLPGIMNSAGEHPFTKALSPREGPGAEMAPDPFPF